MRQTPSGLLVQRFGYGAYGGVIPAHDPADLLSGPDLMAARWPIPSGPEVMARALQRRREERAAARLPKPERQATRSAIQRAIRDEVSHNLRSDLARAVEAEDYYRERLVRFWADHFSVLWKLRVERPVISAFHEDAIRPHIAGRFGDLLRAAITHPMMLRALDQASSSGPGSAAAARAGRGLNENLGRELLELHTLGAGADYDQQDVREAALLLTGLRLDAQGALIFDPAHAEPGAEVVLGQSFGGDQPSISDIHALLEHLSTLPATALHLSRKLAVHFVADTPDQGLIHDLRDEWLASGGDLARVSTALRRHPKARAATLLKARQPFDFLVAALRSLEVTGAEIFKWNRRRLAQIVETPLQAMGQPWQMPGGPDGWPEALERWITPQALAARIDWAMQVPVILRRPLPDPRAFAARALPGLADPALERFVARAESAAEGVGITLASPSFNRR